MLVGGVARHEVEQHVNAAGMRLVKELYQVLVRAIPRRDLLVVTHVVACIHERRVKAGVNPQGIATQFRDVVQTLDDSLQVPNAIAVRVLE